ncbi:MAG TPA: hypothetical protein VK904_03485, partial [Miltoncostaeaceae bacterium]|nr:hypothetical protein [Miltoncostaeaceae bacterium]
MDVWSDDVLKEVLRETRRRRSYRRWLRVSAICVAVATGAALAWLLAPSAGRLPGATPVDRRPAIAAAPASPAPATVLAPIVDLLAHGGPPTPLAGAAPVLVDLLLSAPALEAPLPDRVPAPLVQAAREFATAGGFGEALEPPGPSPVVEGEIEPGDTLLGGL